MAVDPRITQLAETLIRESELNESLKAVTRHTECLADQIEQAVQTYIDGEKDAPADTRDEAYERAVARARGNDFVDTDGRDWT